MANPHDGDIWVKASRRRRVALKAICKVSIGCIALAITLPQAAFAGSHLVISAIGNASAVLGQTRADDEAVRRHEADKLLRAARRALEAGQPDAAERYVTQAEKFNARYDATTSRFADSPAKLRRDIGAVRAAAAPAPRRPSQQFTPTSPQPYRASPRAPGNFLPAGRDQMLNQLTNSSKAQASEFLNRGRQALQQGDKTAALSWYQRAVATGALFAPGEFSPQRFAADLQRAGIDMSRIAQVQPASPYRTKPSDFASTELDRLPAITPMPTSADSAFEGGVITNPSQLVNGPRAAGPASPRKLAAMRYVAQAQAALARGDLRSAQQFAENAKAIQVPDHEFAQNEMRPWELSLQIQSQINRQGGSRVVPAGNYETIPAVANGSTQPGRSPVSQGIYTPESDQTRNRYAQAEAPIPTPAARGGEPSPGLRMYQDGLRALEAQDRDSALRLFRDAWQYEQELDPAVRQELRDKLTLLNVAGNRPLREPSPLEEVNAQQELLRQQLFREITNETKAAAEMVPTDPRGALQRVTQLRERVSQAEIDPAARRQLLLIVDKEASGIDSYIQQNGGAIQLKERNREVVESIDRDRAQQIAVQQQIAVLVDEFNVLLDQERYEEAEVRARQIRELEPDSPVTRLVTTKSKMARRIARNQWIADEKEDGFIR